MATLSRINKASTYQMKTCDGCVALREEVKENMAAFRALVLGYAPTGRAVPKCLCGRFVTVETRTTHPVAGMRTYLLCDHCEPPRLEFDKLGRTESMDWGQDCAWARSVNERCF